MISYDNCLSLSLLRMVTSRFSHVAANDIISFFFNGRVIFPCIYVQFFIDSSVSGHLGCFYDLAIVNSPAVNIWVHVSFWSMVFSYNLLNHMVALGEGNGNPLQYSRLENPVDRGAWWAAVHRVAQSWTQLK